MRPRSITVIVAATAALIGCGNDAARYDADGWAVTSSAPTSGDPAAEASSSTSPNSSTTAATEEPSSTTAKKADATTPSTSQQTSVPTTSETATTTASNGSSGVVGTLDSDGKPVSHTDGTVTQLQTDKALTDQLLRSAYSEAEALRASNNGVFAATKADQTKFFESLDEALDTALVLVPVLIDGQTFEPDEVKFSPQGTMADFGKCFLPSDSSKEKVILRVAIIEDSENRGSGIKLEAATGLVSTVYSFDPTTDAATQRASKQCT